MKKTYRFNGKTLNFSDVHMEAGCLYGRCTNLSHYGKWAWLDPHGFQFEREHRVEAVEVPYYENTMAVPDGCHYWGGEIRNNSAWRKQW